jgi:Histidine kinase-, DNA gyrase B-, and HSP90-like ATPase
MTGAPETVRIPPHPRILRALAEIDFDHWQCVAELVDNGFDEFLEIERSDVAWPEPFRVHVALPQTEGDRVVVTDNGRGMSLDRVTDAARAGYSANDPLSKLGLFGMGFNVATARLGGLTTFLSTRAEDKEWAGVRIDVRNMDADFAVPVVRVPKTDPTEHGTRIEVDALTPLARHFNSPTNRTRLRQQLGGVYSYLLEHRGYELVVDSTPVTPYRHCVWGSERSVVRGGDIIPARIPIDRLLPAMKVCSECATWQSLDSETCQQCSSKKLAERERRVHGWLGISRELQGKEFGIDFLRNGRKILRFDRSLFEWVDPDDVSGAAVVEYPIETPPNKGRIVGEIHLDHVPVIYTKDAFDSTDRGWRTALRIVRGDTSLLPKTAKARGDAPNESPLATLHRGFRRNDPGTGYLTAGDGSTRMDTSDWVAAFHRGESAYQADTKWWEAAVEHERIKEQEKLERERRKREQEQSDREERDEPTSEFFDGPESPPDSEPTEELEHEPEPLTEQERIERWEAVGRPMRQLDGEYTAKGIGIRPVPLNVIAVRGTPIVGSDGDVVPVHLVSRAKGAFTAFVDLDHPLFASFDDSPEDLVLVALAQMMVVRAKSSVPLAAVYSELKKRYLPERALNSATLQAEANQLLADVQARMTKVVADDPSRPWNKALADHERALTRERVADALRTSDFDKVISSGEYLPYAPPSAVPRIVSEWPEAFLDGYLFSRPYRGLEAAAQQQVLGRIVGYLNDAAWLAASPVGADRDELLRARLSVELLPDEFASGAQP